MVEPTQAYRFGTSWSVQYEQMSPIVFHDINFTDEPRKKGDEAKVQIYIKGFNEALDLASDANLAVYLSVNGAASDYYVPIAQASGAAVKTEDVEFSQWLGLNTLKFIARQEHCLQAKFCDNIGKWPDPNDHTYKTCAECLEYRSSLKTDEVPAQLCTPSIIDSVIAKYHFHNHQSVM